MTTSPRNPKRTTHNSPTHINWFPYYAGYSSEFVHDVISSLKLRKADTILDPWNGSGTTTTTAHRLGIKGIGCDINPIMVVAAKSALLEPGASPSLVPLAEEILHAAESSAIPSTEDPLSKWYVPSSAADLRRLHFAIWKVLVSPSTPPTLQASDISHLSTLAAFFLTAMLRTTRYFLTAFVGSNPTWIRTPKTLSNRVRPSREVLFEHFRMEVRRMAASLDAAFENRRKEPRQGLCPTIIVESSTSLPIPSRSVKAIVSSPPYLTRIDYAVATMPELAALGMSLSAEFDALRRSMIGAPAVKRGSLHSRPVGDACSSFLREVEQHPSKGSQNYYHKLFVQYFTDMTASLSEISRVLVRNGTCVLVVQDSYYKELHADLAQFTTEMARHNGLALYERHDYKWTRNMVRVNSRARQYRESAVAVESALWFSKN